MCESARFRVKRLKPNFTASCVSCARFWTLFISVVYSGSSKTVLEISRTRMHMRFLATTVIALALLFSQSAGLVVAALCPHLRSDKDSCDTQTTAEPTHHGVAHTQLEAELAEFSGSQNGDAVTIAKQSGSCSHCAVHSRTNRNTASSEQSNVPQRLNELTITLGIARIHLVPASQAPAWSARAHGPPGDIIPRHVLLNTFRI